MGERQREKSTGTNWLPARSWARSQPPLWLPITFGRRSHRVRGQVKREPTVTQLNNNKNNTKHKHKRTHNWTRCGNWNRNKSGSERRPGQRLVPVPVCLWQPGLVNFGEHCKCKSERAVAVGRQDSGPTEASPFVVVHAAQLCVRGRLYARDPIARWCAVVLSLSVPVCVLGERVPGPVPDLSISAVA